MTSDGKTQKSPRERKKEEEEEEKETGSDIGKHTSKAAMSPK